jgi:L-alanine-DL-glutamate epimerase-like enolase superfamily enzyme
MRITRLEAWPVKMQLAEAYTIAYERIDSATNVFIRIQTDKGFVGYGCAAPNAEVTGETPKTVLQICRDVIEPALQRADPLRLAMLAEKLKPILSDNPSAMAMVDMALHDLLGKIAGLPIYLLLGGFRTRIKTSVTIGILSSAETVVKADIERVIKVREAVGGRIELRFDANQGYTEAEALRFVEKVRPANWRLSSNQPTGVISTC